MASEIRIQCINKTDRYDPHERISHVGGENPDGSRWRLEQQDAIRRIENGEFSFYVLSGGSRAAVVVAVSRYSHKYLKTVADGDQPNNLLSLPECP
jgi:hypothetical protein